MSTRGGYCFVIDGKEIIVFTGNNAGFESLGETVLGWIKDFRDKSASGQAKIKTQIASLEEVTPSAPVPDEELRGLLQEYPFIRPLSISHEYDWYSIMRHLANNPQAVLDMGCYIDGSWLIDSVDCEYLYIVDFDEEVFEIYYDTALAQSLSTSGRFNERAYQMDAEVNRDEAQYINLLCAHPFDELPDTIRNLQDDIYEEDFWEAFRQQATK